MDDVRCNLPRRPRRLRRGENLRSLVRETPVSVDDFIMPMFVAAGSGIENEIDSMPGIRQLSIDKLAGEVESLLEVGVSRVILFGIPPVKDAEGSDAISDDGIIQRATRHLKEKFPELYVVTDVCMCEYTDHGHCGILHGEEVDNDATLPYLGRQAATHARAGADMVAPSGMMDGMVAAIRTSLDDEGFVDVPIMSYSVKYASAYYGPFRDAAESAPRFGDRKAYQMDPANVREGLREAELDIAEGADIVMVKPALAYLDVIARVKASCNVPVACYNVSGEYSMIKAAGRLGWVDEERVMMETLTAMKRAGADIILTYFAKEAAALLRRG
jgi:porphobilinogen synthase